MITTLTVVNEMLGLLGELPLNDVQVNHPVVPKALTQLDTANATVQGDQWWFNTEYPTIAPQVGTKYILLPSDCLSVDALVAVPSVAQRGNKLYNLDDSTYEFDLPVQVKLHRLIPFEDLPHNARVYVAAQAMLTFQNTIDGDSVKTQLLKARVDAAKAQLSAEHTRKKQVNMFNRPGIRWRLANIVGAARLFR